MKLRFDSNTLYWKKQFSRGIFRKRCSENMQQVYRRTSMPKCDFSKAALHFIEITLRYRFSPVNLLYFFRTPFYQNTYGGLLLRWAKYTGMRLGLCQTTITEMFGKMFNKWVLLTMEKSSINSNGTKPVQSFITFVYAQNLP